MKPHWTYPVESWLIWHQEKNVSQLFDVVVRGHFLTNVHFLEMGHLEDHDKP